MSSPLRKLPLVGKIVKVVNLHFSEMHHVRWMLDKIYESTQASLSRPDAVSARIDSLERAAASLLLNDTAMLNAASESLAAIDRLAKNTAERHSNLSLELKNVEGEIRRTANSIAHASEQISRVGDFASTLARLQASNRDETVVGLCTLQESVKGVSEALNQAIAELNDPLGILIDRSDETKPIRVATADNDVQEPEIALTQYLYSYLPHQNAVDIGANVGDFSARLLECGYKVAAFEPYEPAFNALQTRLGSNRDFQAFRLGVGPTDSTMDLHVASDTSGRERFPDPTLYSSFVEHSLIKGLEFTKSVSVEVRSLESLQASGRLPTQVGFLKVDTEGFDLEVLRGMGTGDYSVVMTEFWDAEHPFGRSGAGHTEGLAREMKARGYAWYIVIYHLDNNMTVSFYCNRSRSVPGSWGNIVFFKSNEIFREARRWCEAILRPTIFG